MSSDGGQKGPVVQQIKVTFPLPTYCMIGRNKQLARVDKCKGLRIYMNDFRINIALTSKISVPLKKL